MKYHRYLIMIFLLPLLIVGLQAQELCETLVREAFEAVTENCGDLENASACYGFDSISASFFQSGEDISFKQPSDSVSIEHIQTVRTSPFDEEEEEWGISYFQIMLENNSEPLIIMSTGDVIIENDVVVASETGLGIMQAFNFTTGGESDCREAPNAVFVQGPEDVEIDLLINSVPVRMGSTLVLGTYDDENGQDTMWLGVVEGHAIIDPESENPNTITQGMVSSSPLTNENGDSPDGSQVLNDNRVPVYDPITGEPIIGPNGEPYYRQVPYDFSEPEEIGDEGEGGANWESYAFVNEIPAELQNYDVEVPEVPEEVEEEPLPEIEPNDTQEAPILFPEVTEEIPVVFVDTQFTECGTQNWCNAGEPWGDGRCNDPDPDVSNWFWNAGWYQAQLECGVIETVPEIFSPVEPATPAPEVIASPTATPVPALVIEVITCQNNAGTVTFLIEARNMPSNLERVGMLYAAGTLNSYVINPATPPGPDSGLLAIPSGQIPLIEAFVEYTGVVGPVSVPIAGPTSC